MTPEDSAGGERASVAARLGRAALRLVVDRRREGVAEVVRGVV